MPSWPTMMSNAIRCKSCSTTLSSQCPVSEIQSVGVCQGHLYDHYDRFSHSCSLPVQFYYVVISEKWPSLAIDKSEGCIQHLDRKWIHIYSQISVTGIIQSCGKRNQFVVYVVQKNCCLTFVQVFGGREERASFLRGSAKVVMYAIARYIHVGYHCQTLLNTTECEK